MARYSLDPNNLMVQSFVTGAESGTAETIADETVAGARDTIVDYTCAGTCNRTCGATCGFTCDGNILCGVQSMVAYCASEAKAC